MTDYLGGALDVNNIPVDDKTEKLLVKITDILYASFPMRYDIACETADKIMKEIEDDKE
jgi:hypothetical protein